MAKGIKETLMETRLDTNLMIDTDEILQASVETSVLFMGDHYRVKRICTKTDNDLKAIMIAHLKTRSSEHASYYTSKQDHSLVTM